MYIALMSHDNKKELMVQFCTAYAGILSRHNLCATNTTGRMVTEAGLLIQAFMPTATRDDGKAVRHWQGVSDGDAG